MLKRLGRFIAHHSLVVIGIWLVVVVSSFALALGFVGPGLFPRLTSDAPTVPGSEYNEAMDRITAAQHSATRVDLIVVGVDLEDTAQVTELMSTMASERDALLDLPGVESVTDPFQFPTGPADPDAAALLSTDGDGFIVQVELESGLSEQAAEDARVAVENRLGEVAGNLGIDGAEGLVSDDELLTASVVDQAQEDLTKGEAITLPVSFAVMVLVFGGFLAALMPLVGAIASIGTGMAMMLGATYFLELDSNVVNILAIMGLALSIDYGLLVVSRFREELMRQAATARARTGRGRRRHDPAVVRAMETTLATAGRTVLFSALTVAISISGLLVMKPTLLKAVALAGVAIVLLAVLTAVTLVPAHLALIGRKFLKPSPVTRIPGLRAIARTMSDVSSEHGFFSRLAAGVHRRPWFVMLPILAVLLVLASPLLHTSLRSNVMDYIPDGTTQRAYVDTVAEKFPTLRIPDIYLVTSDSAEAEDLAAQVQEESIVDRAFVTSLDDDDYLVAVQLNVDSATPEALDLVRDLRAQEGDFLVAGSGALLIDFVGALADGLPWAMGIVVAAVFVLLFLMTGSLVIPLKALIINLLSLGASLGVTAWVFQEGHLTNLLDFTPHGGIDMLTVSIALAFGFGLAMDYEMFLLSRIKEYWDATGNNDLAVERGLQKSGRIITSAALVMLLVLLGFVTGKLIVIKQIGFALAVTVFLDATLVRMLLVPATMTILGKWNWWAPKPLQKLYHKFGIAH